VIVILSESQAKHGRYFLGPRVRRDSSGSLRILLEPCCRYHLKWSLRFHQISSDRIRVHQTSHTSYIVLLYKSLDLCPFGVEVPVVAEEAPMPCHLRGWAHRHVATYCHSRVFIRQCREGTPQTCCIFCVSGEPVCVHLCQDEEALNAIVQARIAEVTRCGQQIIYRGCVWVVRMSAKMW